MLKKMNSPAIWADWEHAIVSLHETPGFERIPFVTDSTMQANLQI